jgi:DNA sulfur modification protein DndB
MGEEVQETEYLTPLLSDPGQLKREAVRRRKQFEERSVAASELPEHETAGWVVDRELKKKTRVKREKELDERLENRFWSILFRMGYPEMNGGRSFTVLIQRKGAEPLRKQIDVFAKDDETVVVAECKASEKVAKRSLQKDIEEFANLKGPIAAAVHAHYGRDFKPKIIWLFVTENIVWSSPDKERAAGEQIRVITERELRYYSQIAEHLGKAARYQFLAEFLKDQQIPELADKIVPAIRGKLGGRRFYCFVTRPRDLLKIAFVNHRSLNDPDGAPTYQRLISKSRLREIGKYVAGGGYFPTNLLVNFTRVVRFDKIAHDEATDVTHGRLHLPDRYRSAWVIDGQHRLYGFSSIEDRFLDQNIVVVAFERLPTEEEANLFVTINHEQKSVPKHLLDDLEGELKWGSDVPSERIGAIGARLINLLNADIGEPFHNRVTQQGITSTSKMCLTIPAIKDALRRSGLLGKAVLNRSNYELGPLCGKDDSETLDKARSALNLYFSRIRNANMEQWESGREGFLCTNTAVQAHLMLFASLIQYMEGNTAQTAKEMPPDDILMEIEEFWQPVLDAISKPKLEDLFGTVPFGSGGPPEYYYRLCRICKLRFADFSPEGMETWEDEQSEEKITTADRRLKDIVVAIQKYIFDTLRSLHGVKGDAYWHKGITDKTIKADAYKRSLDEEDDARLPLENYLDVIDYKKIVENKQNWPMFSSVFNIPEPGEKGHAKNLKWLDRINELRRIPGHPSEKRTYKSSDFEYIEFVYQELLGRIKNAEALPQLPAEPSSDSGRPVDDGNG